MWGGGTIYVVNGMCQRHAPKGVHFKCLDSLKVSFLKTLHLKATVRVITCDAYVLVRVHLMYL